MSELQPKPALYISNDPVLDVSLSYKALFWSVIHDSLTKKNNGNELFLTFVSFSLFNKQILALPAHTGIYNSQLRDGGILRSVTASLKASGRLNTA